MHRSHRNRLLRDAAVNPHQLLTRKKFWKLEFWNHYLARCDDLVFDDPRAGLAFSKPAPQLAAKIAETHPGVSAPDLLLLANSYLGSAFRRVDDYPGAEKAFKTASQYTDSVSPRSLAEYLRRLAYLLLYRRDPECFTIIEKAISIHKRGHLVNRHALGECFICRARAFVMFNLHGKGLEDYTAALNHVSIKIDPKPYSSALHSLVAWAADYVTDEELRLALEHLKAARLLLSTCGGRPFQKLTMRWLIAVVDARLGRYGRAREVFLEVRQALVKLELGYEIGMVSIDLAFLYLDQERDAEIDGLIEETVEIFHQIGVPAKANEALDIWRNAVGSTGDLLKSVRKRFVSETRPILSAASLR